MTGLTCWKGLSLFRLGPDLAIHSLLGDHNTAQLCLPVYAREHIPHHLPSGEHSKVSSYSTEGGRETGFQHQEYLDEVCT